MSRDPPDPEAFRIPTVEELEALRQAYGIPKRVFSRRAGYSESAWWRYTQADVEPGVETMRAFLGVLQAADPEADHETRGRPPACGQDPQAPDGGDA